MGENGLHNLLGIAHTSEGRDNGVRLASKINVPARKMHFVKTESGLGCTQTDIRKVSHEVCGSDVKCHGVLYLLRL